jgi:branched-chain amino acid transport system ATP-binding protein
VLSVEGVSVAIGASEILRDISVAVGTGEVVCLVGRNGAGKTTLLRTVMGWLSPRVGRVVIGGRDAAGLPPHAVARLGVGYSPEDCGVFAGLTVEENVRVATWARPGGRPAEERVAEACSLFPALRGCWRRKGGEMSGGERKMLSIARALATDARLLLLDEPFEGLAPVVVPTVAEGIGTIARTGRGVLVAESNAHHVPGFANRVVILERGEVVHTGPPETMWSDEAVRRIVEGGS